MKRVSFILIMILLSLCVFFVYSQSSETESTEGEVISVSSDQIEIKEYDLENDSYFNRVYIINSETELIGAETVTEITEGTTIEIEFVSDSRNNFIARSIYVSEIMYNEDEEGDDE